MLPHPQKPLTLHLWLLTWHVPPPPKMDICYKWIWITSKTEDQIQGVLVLWCPGMGPFTRMAPPKSEARYRLRFLTLVESGRAPPLALNTSVTTLMGGGPLPSSRYFVCGVAYWVSLMQMRTPLWCALCFVSCRKGQPLSHLPEGYRLSLAS